MCDSRRAGRRALILGDSFSVDFEGSYGRLLAEYLHGTGAHVANLALSGAGPLDYLERLRTCAERLKPELVVVNYYVGNDASDTVVALSRRSASRDRLRSAVKTSYLGSLALEIRARWAETRRLRALEQRQGRVWADGHEVLNPFIAEAGRAYPDEIVDNLLLEKPDMQRAWQLNRGLLRDMRRLSEAAGGRLLLAILPATAQVSRSHAKFYADLGYRMDERVFESDVPQRLLGAFCEDERIHCIDLLPEFRRRQPRRFYLDNDDHWNGEGQALAFTVVRGELERLGWVP
jgi:lysophospholipase L1-like esterase